MGGWRLCCLGPVGTSSAFVLPGGLEHTRHAGLAAQVHALVGQHGDDARRWRTSKARLVATVSSAERSAALRA